MVLAYNFQPQLLADFSTSLFQIFSNDLILLLVGGVCAFLLAYLSTFGVIAVCRKVGWLDEPGNDGERIREHKEAVPRLGGVAMFLAFVVASLLFYATDKSIPSAEVTRYWLLLVAATLIVVVHVYDDVKGVKPWPKLLAQTLAVLIILGPGTCSDGSGLDGKLHFCGVFLYGFSNPFGVNIHHLGLPWYREPILTLFIHRPEISLLAIPAILFTWFWIVGMMNTVNLIDGVDGLATGVVGITGLFITIISWTLGQHSIAILSAIFTGAVLGFLPHNWNPARIFMGDSGSQFLGVGLAVLAIIGGAKIALALMVLGIPILDVAIVMLNRVRRGQSPLHYDNTHLHYRLKATGLSAKQICYLFYGLTIVFGVMGLQMPRLYKLIGIGLVGLTMAGIIIWIDYRQRQRGVPMEPGGPTPAPVGGETEPAADEQQATAPEQSKRETTTSNEATLPSPDQSAVLSRGRLPH
ncbi:undecaprenyl/decaprenyl-phosphate alpha-N-acetylglucosaminyl 1-phosphate transferase [Ktedonosporobacter rubrisoli]|uniref:Undecaprenyl/decaprenyl-phosphate alpha-N-acetylglucosaminyl 1-phosphate transferase n=1 Tax=Ktedonosporobacter rubrisoli TaxID=2509675 RepID=A0A4P6JTZ4_KTERU|nr:MraY family glycosyltransferase [Ktedonosporobacter rubrisoli]QBD79079.1 undecaprenyl/decaprenyl-phosphate alpha-N-acetylglucosaminyl 1-phosphate transferase [Ktedonosporobacter rubrisoli]